MCGEGDAHLYSDYRHYGMPRDKWYTTVDLVLYVLVRNPLLPTVLTGTHRSLAFLRRQQARPFPGQYPPPLFYA